MLGLGLGGRLRRGGGGRGRLGVRKLALYVSVLEIALGIGLYLVAALRQEGDVGVPG